jgi:hypothetical protein
MMSLLIVASIIALSGPALSRIGRASSDWSFQLRLMIALGYLDELESPQSCLQLTEVLLVVGPLSSNELVLLHPERDCAPTIRFFLDEPMSERFGLCSNWSESETPLLLAAHDSGAVLHGPMDCCSVIWVEVNEYLDMSSRQSSQAACP